MQSGYKDHLQVTPLSDWASLNVPDIFTPVFLYGEKRQTLVSYKDLFYKEGILQKKIILLGKAGTGKTTFCKHLADIWCNPTSKRQFDDVDVLQQFQFLFYVSFRFAEKHETVLEMIRNQLFDDEEMQAIASHVLKHNSDSCLILMDGFDELQRQTLAKTGKRGDITGFPSLTGVQDCILLVTSRPWKFYSLPKEDQRIFSTMELDGIKDTEELIKVILTKLEEPDPAKSCSDFKAQMKNNNMTEIMKSPLMLIIAIDIWESERSLPKSICFNFIKIIESFVCRYQTNREEVITENKEVCVKKLVDKYSESANLLPNILSNYEFVQMHAGLFLSLGHLASDFLLGQENQLLVFQKEACKRYNIKENDGSLKFCLELGILTKLESTMRGIKRTESFQFCHKTFQEFFAALWLSRKYTKEDSQEKLTLHFRIETEDDLLNHGVLIQFMCGLNPELGSDFWKYIAQKNIIQDQTNVDLVQNLILKAVKEAHYCCDTQREQLYYCISSVRIDDDTSDEDISLLCKMIENNSTYLKSLVVIFQCLSYSQYHSLLSYISCATNLTTKTLRSISCQTNVSSDCLPVLYLHKHHKLKVLSLDSIYITGLLLPSQEESRLSALYLDNLVLSYENLVQLCSSLSGLTGLHELKLANISCSDNDLNLGLPVLDLHRHSGIVGLPLNKISISGLLLPNQEESKLLKLYLYNLVLSHDNLVQLCSSLSSLTDLYELKLTNISCSDNSLNLGLPVLDLHRHSSIEILSLSLNKIPIIGLLLPSPEESKLSYLYLFNLVLSHDHLVQLCSSLSSLTGLQKLTLTNISCSDNNLNLGLPVLDLHRHCSIDVLSLDEISISGLLLPSQEESQLSELYLDNLVPSHDNLVQLCSLLSSLNGLLRLQLTNISCSDNNLNLDLPVLDLHRLPVLLSLKKISISGLLLPSHEQSRLRYLYLDNLVLSHDNLVQLCSSLSSLTGLHRLKLTNISCSDNSLNLDLPVLDLHRRCSIVLLSLKKISISGLLLPSQEESKLCKLYLYNLVLSHDNLVQLCTSLPSLTGLHQLKLTNISCSDNSLNLGLPVLDLHRHCSIEELTVNNISISGLLLPSMEESKLRYLYLYNLVLSHENLVQLCSSLSSLTNLRELKLTNISCSDVSGSCDLPVLDLHKHSRRIKLTLDKISISGLYLDNLVLSHDNLVQLCSSLSSLTGLFVLNLTNISCSGSCTWDFPVLDLHRHDRLVELTLNKITISCLLLPSQEVPELCILYLDNLVLSHDNLVQLCSSLSSLTGLHKLKLTNISCSDDSGSCDLPVMDLHGHNSIEELSLDIISMSSLLLPSQEESNLCKLYLENLVLSHDNLVQLCSSLSSLTGLCELELTNCSDESGSCDLPVLNLHSHDRLSELQLDNISISGLLLPSQEESELCGLYINDLVLSHDNLVQLFTSLSFLITYLKMLGLANLTCSDHGHSCRTLLDLRRHDNLSCLGLDKISLSGVLLPNQEEPKLERLWLNNMLLSHDNLVQLCSSLSPLTALTWLQLTSLRCYDHGGSGNISIFDFPKAELENVDLEQIQVEDLQALSGLEDLQVTIMPSTEHSGKCKFTVLDLHKHYQLEKLILDSSSISGMILPRQERLRFKRLVLKNLVLSHYSLEQLCASLSCLSALNVKLHFTKLSCRDHDRGYCFPLLNQPDTEMNVTDDDSDSFSLSLDDSDSIMIRNGMCHEKICV